MNIPLDEAVEAADGERVDEALQRLGRGDVLGAQEMLRDVTSRTPESCPRVRGPPERLIIRFWTQAEFIHYATVNRGKMSGDVFWSRSAYPRAWFYLGFIEVARGDFAAALSYFEACGRLEPDHPRLRNEHAFALWQMGRRQEAVVLYQSVASGPPEVLPSERARAIRAIGFALIESGHLDHAEAHFLISLQLDPDSEIAQAELAYIADLRRGGPKVSSAAVEAGPSGVRPIPAPQHAPPDETPATAPIVSAPSKKAWWEFWK